MRGSVARCAIAALVCIGAASTARATEGGPSSVAWVRWDESRRTVWWALRTGGECDDCPLQIFREDTGTAGPTAASRRELLQIRAHTTPVRVRRPTRDERRAIDVHVRVTDRGFHRPDRTLPGCMRYRLDVAVEEHAARAHRGRADITAYVRTGVHVVGTGDLPGDGGRIIILRWLGIPIESFYDAETVVVLHP